MAIEVVKNPVTRQIAVTPWTMPREFSKSSLIFDRYLMNPKKKNIIIMIFFCINKIQVKFYNSKSKKKNQEIVNSRFGK